MKKWFALGAFFLMSYLVFIIATLPLAFVINSVKLPNHINVQGVSGTVWQGEIAQVVVNQNHIQKINTKLSFWSLFTLTPKVNIHFGNDILPGPQGELTLAISQSTLELSDVTLYVKANDIAQQLKLPLPVTAKGDAELQLSSITISLSTYECQQAQGNVNWIRAGVIAMKQNIKLGQFAADLSCEQGKLAATVSPNNDLGLSFTALVSAQRGKIAATGQGHLKPGAKFPEQLKSALPFLGRADAQGRYRLQF
ncbi:type II secretion system protein N [Colwellia asteriadis]